MKQDDVLFGYRLQIFALAEHTSVAEACRVFGIHRSTYYSWRSRVERHGLEMLRPRERRAPRMPNQLSKLVEQRIVAFALGHPQMGPHRIAAELARERWGGLRVSRQRRLAGALPARHQHPPQAAGLDRGVRRRPTRTAAAASRSTSMSSARRARRHRLLLHRAATRHTRPGLAVHRDRHPLLVCLGGARGLPQRSALQAPRPAAWRAGSPPIWLAAAGGSSACCPTTATNSKPTSAPP